MADSASMKTSWLQRAGLAVDEFFNVICLNGEPDQTVSMHTAVAARDGKRWGCVLCRMLDYLVEQGHCAKQFDTAPTAPLAAFRAALAFAVASMPLLGLWKLIELTVHHLIG